tara:strand:+ start:313 stop:777 length:465 start_codon:yes stop_codon:yes gene_type:complete
MNLKIIKLGIFYLNCCIDLDQKSLKGLWTKSQWEKELTDPKRICIGVINLETKKLLGLCSAWLVIDELHITAIAIDPIHQRKGLGRLLISDLIKRSNSLRTNLIHLEVKDKNDAAKAFYKALDFKIVGNRSNFYKDGSDAIIFNKQLNKKSQKK